MGIIRLQTQIELETGLRVEKVTAAEHLDTVLNTGLAKLYQQVFADPPYNENFSEKQVGDYFHGYLAQGGHIFVALDPKEQDKPIGFVVSVPLKADFAIASKVKDILDIDRAAYFAEDGVAHTHRKGGLSGKMKKLLIEANSIEGINKIILRTNQANYKQISGVNKSGGTVITDLFHDVTSPKENGNMTTDRRAFYLFDTDTHESDAQNVEILNRVVITRPGGNDTAIVFDPIPREQQGDLSLRIQKTYPGIEQVMFVETGKVEAVHGQMAGGEFCGNATRSLGYLLRDGKDGVQTLEVSGADQPVNVVVSGQNARTSVPIKPDFSAIQKNVETGEYIVEMQGISFLVTTPDQITGRQVLVLQDEEEKKARAVKILNETGLAKQPASGLLIADKINDAVYKLSPYIFVRDTQSMYYETGCGSGSAAVGAIAAMESGKSVHDLQVIQPSGMTLSVTVERDDRTFGKAYVDGSVEILFDGRMYISTHLQKTVSSKPKVP